LSFAKCCRWRVDFKHAQGYEEKKSIYGWCKTQLLSVYPWLVLEYVSSNRCVRKPRHSSIVQFRIQFPKSAKRGGSNR
jgi:hypothetical protein